MSHTSTQNIARVLMMSRTRISTMLSAIMWLCKWRVHHEDDDDIPSTHSTFASVSEVNSFAEVSKRSLIPIVVWRIALRFHWLNFKAYDKPWATGFKRYFHVISLQWSKSNSCYILTPEKREGGAWHTNTWVQFSAHIRLDIWTWAILIQGQTRAACCCCCFTPLDYI